MVLIVFSQENTNRNTDRICDLGQREGSGLGLGNCVMQICYRGLFVNERMCIFRYVSVSTRFSGTVEKLQSLV